ncbi:MAG TPA: hypothetical protein VMA36_15335, partial [Candidatus Limnocylindria bacterium]|nr:hypothetical protein [Candidatus Limnocylindria bacterium]
GVHFWSFDRDNDCTLASSSPTCNSYGQAGTLGYTNAFIFVHAEFFSTSHSVDSMVLRLAYRLK